MNKNIKTQKRLVLLDAHAILHRSYHGMPSLSDAHGNPTGALYGYVSMIARIKNDLHPDYIAACYDLPKPTFRHIAYDNYKGHRKETEDELKVQIEASYNICQALNIPVYSVEGFEADDILGTISEIVKSKYEDIEVIIASGDMDTMQLIDDKVKVYTLKKGADTVLYDSQAVIERYGFAPEMIPDYKAIAGDSSDNIIGVPGLGVKGATELIQNYGKIENLYQEIEKENFNPKERGMKERTYRLLTEHKDEAEFSKVLATIRRDAPVEFQPEIWIVDQDQYIALCDKYNFRSLRGKFDDKMSKTETVEAQQESSQIIIDEHLYNDIKVMMNLVNSEMVNAKLEHIYNACNINFDLSRLDELREYLKRELHNMKVAKGDIENNLHIDNMWDYYVKVERPIIDIIENMRLRGITVSRDILNEQSEKLHKMIKSIEKDIYAYAGVEFNLNSPKQLGDILYDQMGLGQKVKKTKTGQKSTGIEMLESMRDEHPIINLIISYRELFKLVSTYIDTLPDFIREDDKIHARLIQNGAATGRFSCEHPNLQNLPARSGAGMEIRKAFIASPDNKLFSLDYSQIELRLAAIMSGDSNMLEIFRNRIDVHAGVAALVYNKSRDEISNDERRHAKAINFGILYGMGVSALKDSMGVDRATAQEFYDKYKSSFSTLMSYLERVKMEAKELGYTITMFGRRRQIPLIKSKLPFMRAQGERIAINAPIQGTGAELIKFAMMDIEEFLASESFINQSQENNIRKPSLILQIHDELIFELDERDNITAKTLQSIMESVLTRRGIDIIPIASGHSEGHNMFELK